MVEVNKGAATVLCCYAREDEELFFELVAHLSVLKRVGLMQNPYNHEVSANTSWKETIDQHIYEANIVLLLISPGFMASGYCSSEEMQVILKRHVPGMAYTIPVLLYPTTWKHSPIGTLEALPAGEKPVSTWTNRDEAFVDVVGGVRDSIDHYWATRTSTYNMRIDGHQTSQFIRES